MNDPQDDKEFIRPNGHVVMDELPNGLADEYLEDEIICGAYKGKSYAVAAIDAARRGDHKEAINIRMTCRESAGQSDAAVDDWLKCMESYDGI